MEGPKGRPLTGLGRLLGHIARQENTDTNQESDQNPRLTLTAQKQRDIF
jgi:hypothetical protein